MRFWKPKTGEQVKLCDLTNQHIVAIYRYLYRSGGARRRLTAIMREMLSRGLGGHLYPPYADL